MRAHGGAESERARLAVLARPAAARLRAGLLCGILATVLLAGCSLFRSSTGNAPPPTDPFANGVLKAVALQAPAGSATQALANIADQAGWEAQAHENPPLRTAIQQGAFEQKVLPYLLGLFYKNGYSVLDLVGPGNEFSRDSIVRGVQGASKLLVTTRNPIHIIFLAPVSNVQLVYPQDGTPPVVFAVGVNSTVTVRKSQLEQYLQ